MKIQQFVMAYGAEQDRLRAMLPEGYVSLRPVLRINAEITDDAVGYLEFNTPVEHGGKRGWLNIAHWEDVPFEKSSNTVTFRTEFLQIAFTGVGIQGGCPAEKDNDGCFFLYRTPSLRLPETISASKEYCHCRFQWLFSQQDAQGESIGKTLPAYPTPVQSIYPKEALSAQNAARIPCIQVLGAYQVCFQRDTLPEYAQI